MEDKTKEKGNANRPNIADPLYIVRPKTHRGDQVVIDHSTQPNAGLDLPGRRPGKNPQKKKSIPVP